MTKRKKVSSSVETTILTQSGRRCCLCYSLNGDFDLKRGQIAHLDGDPSNSDPDNLVYLCFDHHDEYDRKTSQSKGFSIKEVKEYRAYLYEVVENWRESVRQPPYEASEYHPLLDDFRIIPNLFGDNNLFAKKGIQFFSSPSENMRGNLTVFCKTSMYMVEHPTIPLPIERWLYLQAVLAGGYSERIQVQAINNLQVQSILNTLAGRGLFGFLQGLQTPIGVEYLSISSIEGENVLSLTLHSVTRIYSGKLVSFRITKDMSAKLAEYLTEMGFARPFNN